MPEEVVLHASRGSLPSHLPAALSASVAHHGESAITIEDDDSYKGVSYNALKYTWVDRLLGVVCATTSKVKQSINYQTSMPGAAGETDATSSPWILPVYVLSTRQDKDKHQIAMEAKCTIDTGNTQGNIVSRRLVEDVLEYPRSAFCSLTKEEEAGATAITGHQLIPEAAINLTWYHKKSVRVFRDMRFLITSSQHFDIIIGAVSIQKDGLLDVPNLMTQGDLISKVKNTENNKPANKAEVTFEDKAGDVQKKMDDLMAEILKGKNPPKPINWQNKEYANLEDALKVFRDQKQDIFKQGLDPTKLTKQEADQQQARVKEAVEALEKKTETAKAEPEAEEEVSPPPPPYSKSNGLEQASEPRRSN